MENMSTSDISVCNCSYLSQNQIKKIEDIDLSVTILLSRNSEK